jgi:hypothetical protein
LETTSYIRTGGRERESRPKGKSRERRGVGFVVKVIPAGFFYPEDGGDRFLRNVG